MAMDNTMPQQMSEGKPLDIAAEFAQLKHEKKNQKMKLLPPNTTIQRRPLHHSPLASPYAGAQVPKVVYVSCRTPIMSAVKRVKKLLSLVEKRALQGIKVRGQALDSAETIAKLSEASDRLSKVKESVLVKASGKAMGQALRVGEWFRSKEKEILCNVEVRTGNVSAIDDIVELGVNDESKTLVESDMGKNLDIDLTEEASALEGGDTTMELLGPSPESIDVNGPRVLENDGEGQSRNALDDHPRPGKRKRARRKRAVYDKEDLPEARIRWVKTVEVAISLRA